MSPDQPIGAEGAAHLVRRTSFGTAPANDVARLAPLTRAAAVDALLSGLRTTATTALPPLSTSSMKHIDRQRVALTPADGEARKATRMAMQREGQALKAWWCNEMVTTTSPLTERLVLMWHGHFTSSLRKVRVPGLMARQNAMLREHAAGSFRTLLHAVVVDPAMLRYLDGANNRAAAPNENFARELFELFTLGIGHYSERDVTEAARAFTGAAVPSRRRQHDRGSKTILGETGAFAGDDVVDVLLRQRATAATIVRLYWRTFVTAVDDEGAAAADATVFAGHLDLRRLLRDVLLNDAFWAPAAREALIKSPVDIVVGTARLQDVVIDGGADPDAVAGTPQWSARALRRLRQDLFDPPDVRGWPGHTQWVTTATLPQRLIVARAIADLGTVDVDVDDPRFQLL